MVKRIEAVGGKVCLSEHLDKRDSGQGRTLPDHHHAGSATFSKLFCLFFPPPTQEWCIIAHTSGLSAPYCMASPELPGRYLSIKTYCVRRRVRGWGEEYMRCVCHLSDCAFFRNRGCFSLLWRILPLRSEEAGYLPDSDCAEVITVLCWKAAVQEWGLGRGS